MNDEPVYVIDNIRLNTCPCNYKLDSMNMLLRIVDAYDKGLLPFEGCLMDQPAKVMEVIDLISSLKQNYQQEQASKRDNKRS